MCMIGLSISLKTSYLFSLIACCQELTVSFSGNDNFLWANYEHLHYSTWISNGVTNGIDHYIFQEEHAIWFVDGYWLMGPVDDIGTTNYYYMYVSFPSRNWRIRQGTDSGTGTLGGHWALPASRPHSSS